MSNLYRMLSGVISSFKANSEKFLGLDDGTFAQVTAPANVAMDLTDNFSVLDANKWSLTKANSGDIVITDGNVAGCYYLVLSLDPLTVGNTILLESKALVDQPFEMIFGLHTSQRVAGQEISTEVVSTDSNTAATEQTLSSIQQATTTLTLSFASPHGLKVGERFGIYGVPDSRLNYPQLVVATIVNSTQITATAGPGGTIPSLTVGPYAGVGTLFMRPAVNNAKDGTSMIFENITSTQASFYARSDGGTLMPTGTLAGNHSATIASSTSVQALAMALMYSFQPGNEYRLATEQDYIQWMDVPVDAVVAPTNRKKYTQVVLENYKKYKARFRLTNHKSMTVPVAQIVSAVKTGTTTATITFDRPHGLTTSDFIFAYGARDFTNFPNLSTATAVASVVNSTQITVVWGGAVTATTYGGYVSRAQGGTAQNGAITQTAQSATVVAGVTPAGATINVLQITGSATWTGLSIGDYANVIGMRDISTGATLGLDGAYKVRNISSSLLELEPIDGRTLTLLGATNCGGGVIKRTDLRVSYVRVDRYPRHRVELSTRTSGDASVAGSVQVVNSIAVNSVASGANLMGDVGVQYRTTGGIAPLHFISAAGTNAANVKNAAGKVVGWSFGNTTAAWKFVKLHNTAGTPTAGAGVVRTIAIPPNGASNVVLEGGITFATGIGLTATGAGADADTTAVAAGDIVGELFYV